MVDRQSKKFSPCTGMVVGSRLRMTEDPNGDFVLDESIDPAVTGSDECLAAAMLDNEMFDAGYTLKTRSPMAGDWTTGFAIDRRKHEVTVAVDGFVKRLTNGWMVDDEEDEEAEFAEFLDDSVWLLTTLINDIIQGEAETLEQSLAQRIERYPSGTLYREFRDNMMPM